MRASLLWVFSVLVTISAVFAAPGLGVSKSARCGTSFRLTCKGSTFGDCCSQHGYCGSTSSYCDAGCKSGFGECSQQPVSPAATQCRTTVTLTSTLTSGSTPLPSATHKVTPNSRCGKGFGFTCQGSRWGDCCSQNSYCGSSNAYCGNGCQSGFGSCKAK